MSVLKSLDHGQKEAVGLLQIGTFLEYSDLMLYVHLAVLLNELFFPKTDPHTAALISAFTFCSTYVFRPIGALLFGYIGDHIGRKSAIIISTSMMAISCFFMSILPTYAEIGIFASIFMITCRVMQSLSATGEVIGAEIYLSEILKPPASYQLVSWLAELCNLGSFAALLAASLIFKCHANWRTVFILGGMIALSGAIARRKLRETPVFLKNQEKIKDQKESTISKKTSIAYFLVYAGYPPCFYLIYIYSAQILKNTYNYTAEQIINHNLFITLLSTVAGVSVIFLVKRFNPLKLIKVRGMLAALILFLMPIIHLENIYYLIGFQVLLTLFTLQTVPAIPIFFKHFPVHRRFTYSSMLYALSRAIMYVTTSFGLVYLIEIFGYYGIWVIMLPVTVGYLWAVTHFEELEKIPESEESFLLVAAA